MPACLTASGLIAGEAILGLVWAGLQFAPAECPEAFAGFQRIRPISWDWQSCSLLALIMIRTPLGSAGSPDEPAPPVAMM